MALFEKKFFNPAQEKLITDAIKAAEENTSGEIRLHVEPFCKIDVLDRAADIFGFLHMHETELRNGVLFYLAYEDHQFAILGDGGINAVVPKGFWDEEKDLVIGYFKRGEYAEGLAEAIKQAGEKLREHFPYQSDDKNELSDDISYG